MKRHPKKLTKKAKNCEVTPTRYRGTFTVESPSGSTYYVRMLSAGNGNEMHCGCKWGKIYPNRACAHKVAVILWLEASGRKWASFWATKEDAQRQHRHRERVGDLWLTTRKATA